MDSAGDFLMSLPKDYHYVFDAVHFLLCIQGDRADLADSFDVTSKTHPLACWLSAMVSCFAGALLVNPLCGEPVLSAFSDWSKVALATLLWFLVYYTPKDLFDQLVHIFPIRLLLYIIKGLYYPKKVMAGMKHSLHELPGNYFAVFLVAACKGNGSGIIKPVCRLLRGVWRPMSTESMMPSLCTKYCLLATLLLLVFPGHLTYVCISGLFLAMKVGPLFSVPVDLFSPIEQLLCPLVLGVPEEKKEK